MNAATNCEKGESMPEVWAVIVTVILLLVILVQERNKYEQSKK
jgi:hypothetical protein